MISFLKGDAQIFSGNTIIIENNGVGYKIFCTNSVINSIYKNGHQIKVYTFLSVRQDELALFGFNSVLELSMFEKLISVSGVGAKSAISLLSTFSPSQISLAIATGDVKLLSTGQGIGKKTAERIILELKDKVSTDQYFDTDNTQDFSQNLHKKDAIEALQVLGFSRLQATETINNIKQELNTEDLISLALKMLSGGDLN